MKLPKGRYKHYKGAFYELIDTARHSETEEWLVVYRTEYGEKEMWVRPLEMFCSSVEIDGREVPRFAYVGDAS